MPLTMMDKVRLGYWYRENINYFSCCCNNDKKNLNKKLLKCLWVREVVDIGLLRLDTIPQVILEIVKVV